MDRDWLLLEISREVAKPLDLVSRESADMDFHSRINVHPDIRYTVLARETGRLLVRQEARVLGIPQRDELIQTVLDDGTVVQEVVTGSNRGGRIVTSHDELGPDHTRIRLRLEVPMRGVKRLLKPLLAWGIREAAQKALAEDCAVLETGRYEAYLATLPGKRPMNILVTE